MLTNGASITIAAGASTGSVSVAAPTDDVYIDAGSISATIASATGGNFENLVINPAAATTGITDTLDTTTVSLTASASVAEGGSVVYTASLNNVAQSPVTLTLSNGATSPSLPAHPAARSAFSHPATTSTWMPVRFRPPLRPLPVATSKIWRSTPLRQRLRSPTRLTPRRSASPPHPAWPKVAASSTRPASTAQPSRPSQSRSPMAASS